MFELQHRRNLLVMLMAVLPAWHALPVSSAEYFVAPKGSDQAKGTRAAPWSLAKANAALQPGDTASLLAGTYDQTPIQPARSGAKGKPITYRAAPGEKPLFTRIKHALELSKRTYIVLRGLHVKDTGRWAFAVGASHLTVENCRFEMSKVPSAWESFRLKQCGDDLVFRGNLFKSGNDSLAIQAIHQPHPSTTLLQQTSSARTLIAKIK